MADLVIDEWLWSDLSGENAIEKQKEALRFLTAVFQKCDRIATVKGSRFQQKSIALWKHTDVTRREIAKFYKASFWYKSDKTLLLEEDQLQDLPVQMGVKPDDRYLVRAYLTAQASVIITTDTPLIDVLVNHNVVCKNRDDFVPDYISKYGQQ